MKSKYFFKILFISVSVFLSKSLLAQQSFPLEIIGSDNVDSDIIETYVINHYLDNQIVNVDWQVVTYVNSNTVAGIVTPVNYDAAEIDFFESYNNAQIEIKAIVTDTNNDDFTLSKIVNIEATSPYYIENSNPQYGENSIITLGSETNLNNHTTNWSLTGGSTIIQSDNNFVEINWNSVGTHTLVANVTHTPTGTNYVITKQIEIEPTYRVPPLIIGKTAVNLEENFKYNLKSENLSNISTNWSIVGGNIIESNNIGVVIRWTSNAGTVSASVDYNDGLAPYQTELEVIRVPDTPSPYISDESQNENFIKSTTYLDYTIGNQSSNIEKIESIQYYDNLGRPKQTIELSAGGDQEDIITPIEYDAFGNQTKQFLPYAIEGNEAFRTQAKNELFDFYNVPKYENTLNPFSETSYDSNVFKRVLKQTAPGSAWEGDKLNEKTIRKNYDIAKDSDNVQKLGIYFTTSHYEPHVINDNSGEAYYKEVIKNENWSLSDGKDNTQELYRNYQNNLVLDRKYENGIPYETYYVYDEYGNLGCVIPPKATLPLSQSEVHNLCYLYIYGQRNRLIEKKIPGKGWEYIVYDKLDRPILTQDANMRSNNEWLFTKYDKYNRIAYTGKFSYIPEGTHSNSARKELQNIVNQESNFFEEKLGNSMTFGNTTLFYTNNSFPQNNLELLTINYYDNYNVDLNSNFNYSNSFNQTLSTNNNGLITVTKVKVLDTNYWITKVNYYDQKARLIYSIEENPFLNTIDYTKFKLGFIGNIIESLRTQEKIDELFSITIKDVFTFDHQGRPLTQVKTINNQTPELIVNNHYDELGNLENKRVGGQVNTLPENSFGLQKIDFTYNIRGWLKSINTINQSNSGRYVSYFLDEDDLFAYKVNYYQSTYSGFSKQLFNGNIREVNWISKNDNKLRTYTYQYDNLNRIKNASYYQKNSLFDPYPISYNINYTLHEVNYDKNGNIIDLERSGYFINSDNTSDFGTIDQLNYTYDSESNRLISVDDLSNIDEGFKDDEDDFSLINDYSYDNNGNLIKDLNKKINNIEYNLLNLPVKITFDNSSIFMEAGLDQITYIYDALGNKLRKNIINYYGGNRRNIDITNYANGFIYTATQNEQFQNPYWFGNSVIHGLQFFSHSEGYVQPSTSISNEYEYIYQYKDHLGNVRLSYKKNDVSSVSFLDDFANGTDGWISLNATSINVLNDQLNVNPPQDTSGEVSRTFDVNSGETLNISIDFQQSTTGFKPFNYLNIEEYIDGVWQIAEETGYQIPTKLYIGNTKFNFIPSGTKVRVKIGSLINFSIDNFEVNQQAVEIVEENNYYPFGLQHKGYNNVINGTENNYQTFQGQEEEKELGKNTYAFQWRDYDPAIARFNKIDRFAEKYYSITPYHFAANNPVFFNEIAGDSIEGVSRKSARRARREIRKTFRENKKLARLFKTKGSKFKGISQEDFDNATQNSSDDEKALAQGYFDAVNSQEIHTVEAVKRGEKLDSNLSQINGYKTGEDVDNATGGGFNYGTSNGSHTVIVTNSTVPITDYRDNSTGARILNRTSSAGELLAHELLGHGLTRYNTGGNQFLNAIQLTNLYNRVTNTSGSPYRFYRDGSRHGGNPAGAGVAIPGTISWQVPLYLK